ncbi:MAG: glycoside hydrolase family 2 TIM barrel-domain containing protein [Bacteroidota bacterium]|nr:glycoside hydrolase family 2 TIM barrel-domain containing protein [Bacteroidota bacterium]
MKVDKSIVLFLFSFLITVGIRGIEYKHVFNPQQGLVKYEERPYRDEICLNGKWKFMPLYEAKASDFTHPDVFRWEATDIKIPSPWNVNDFTDKHGGDFLAYPSYPSKWTKAKIAWMKKDVEVPANWSEKQLILHFEGILGKAVIYVNGEKVGENFELFLPFEVNVSSFIRPGAKNEIVVGVAKADLFDTQGKYGRRTYVGGSMWGTEMVGIWQDVYLFAYPNIMVSGVFVQPDVRNDILKLAVDVRNNTSETKTITLGGSINKWVNSAGKQLAEIPAEKGYFETASALIFSPQKITIPPHTTLSVDLQKKVSGQLNYWTPDSPDLYGAVVTLIDKKNVTDKKIERFGWRQFTDEGGKLFLNGKPLLLKGDSWHFTGVPQMTRRYAWAWFNMLKDANANAVRLHAQPFPRFYLDVADEMGICVLDETGIWASDGGPKIDSDEYWNRCELHLRKLITRDRNHPAVFGWSVCNENLPVAMYVFKAPEELVQKQISEINHWVAVTKEMDPTRFWISGDGETDKVTDLPVVIGHYGDESSIRHWSSQNKVWGVGETSMAYYGTPKQVSKINGVRSYESMLGRMEGIAQESYDLIKQQRNAGASYASVFNLAWYALQPLALGKKDLSVAPKADEGIFFGFEEGLPGMQPERLGPYTTTLNPGYDDALPLYRTWPMFDAVKAANSPEIKPYTALRKGKESVQHSIKPVDVTVVLGSAQSSLRDDLVKIGLTVKDIATSKLTSNSLIIIDGKNVPTNEKLLKSVKNAISSGSQVLVWGADPEGLNVLNTILPYKLELQNRKATSFLKEKDVAILQGLNHAEFYFSELLQRGKTAMNYGLSGDFMHKATPVLVACPTDWQCWNYQAETTKTANVYRSELETSGSATAMAELNEGKMHVIISSLDFTDIPRESELVVHILLSNLGVGFNSDNTSKMKAIDEQGCLKTALICGAFNIDSKSPIEMIDNTFIPNETDLKPVLGTVSNGRHWVLVNSKPNGTVDIRNAQISGSNENAAVYLSFWIFSPRSLVNLLAEPDMPKLDMLVGAEKAFAVFVNGICVGKKESEHFEVGSNKIQNLPLEKGWNHFLIKIAKGSGEGSWNTSFRFHSDSEEYMKQVLSSVVR